MDEHVVVRSHRVVHDRQEVVTVGVAGDVEPVAFLRVVVGSRRARPGEVGLATTRAVPIGLAVVIPGAVALSAEIDCSEGDLDAVLLRQGLRGSENGGGVVIRDGEGADGSHPLRFRARERRDAVRGAVPVPVPRGEFHGQPPALANVVGAPVEIHGGQMFPERLPAEGLEELSVVVVGVHVVLGVLLVLAREPTGVSPDLQRSVEVLGTDESPGAPGPVPTPGIPRNR